MKDPTPNAKITAEKFACNIPLNTPEAALMIGADDKTLNNWRSLGKGPKYKKLGQRSVRYLPRDLQAFMDGAKPA